MSSLLNYKYYDTPEGRDVWKKAFVTSKYAGMTGFIMATHDVWMYSHPKGIFNTVYRYAWYLGPMVGMATTFTFATNALQNYRGKNDKLNYFVGGALAGSIYGAWQKTPLMGMYLGLLFGIAGVVKKSGLDNGWTFLPRPTHEANNAWSVKHDYTLTPELAGRHFTTNVA